MKYELELFDRIISGDLYPFKNNTEFKIDYHYEISQKHQACFKLILATVKPQKNKFELVSKKEMCALHPLAIKTIIPQPTLFQNTDVESIPLTLLKLLSVSRENIVNSLYYKQASKTIICIKEKIDLYLLPIDEAKYYYYNEILKSEVSAIKQKIKTVVFQYTDTKNIEHYIHKQQQAIVNLCYRLIKLINPKQKLDIYKASTKFTNTDILNLTFISLEGLLRFIEKDYLNFIDGNIEIPCRSTLIKSYDINRKLGPVKTSLLNSGIEHELLQVMYVPLLKLTAIMLEEKVTYGQLTFLNLFLTRFHEYFSHQDTIDGIMLLEISVDLNYNAIEAVNYKIKLIQKDLVQFEAVNEKVDFLYKNLKRINQLKQSSQSAYNSQLPSLKYQITTWLEEEINYLNKKLILAQPTKNLFTHEAIEKIKIHSGLSVAQLAYFHKLQYDAGIIVNKNQRDISRFIAENYQTSKVHEISLESINSKYYNVEESTSQTIKDLLIKMLNEINRN